MNKASQAVTVLEHTNDRVLCLETDRPICNEGFEVVIEHFDRMIAKHGKARMLTHFKPYLGWEESAVATDMDFTLKYGKDIEKMAFINAPEQFMFTIKSKGKLMLGDIRFFDEEDFGKALEWINE